MAASANCEKYAGVETRMRLDVLSVNVHIRRRGEWTKGNGRKEK
jgi:hypothetical protein